MIQIKWISKEFLALTLTELYEILALRTEVFIVEQNCPFQDQDGKKDFKAIHLLGIDATNQLVAFSRILPPGVSYIEASIGRVVCSPTVRGLGIGKILMEKSIEVLYEAFGIVPIKIGAQYYLKVFYESFGFQKTSEIYLEDGIEHIEMVKMP
jgi:ElaA protein